ncbi:uncharacterized protein PB18E9.04c [Drosophila innubila]|uniref:uncharacterized protein PB18E9.04c n=1 Tax=Drosophila innubila TaxID=198719 RepID=UPI00148CDCCE|nr:uncharacterized protein PB18E9.04c [Drosophila innubila]
MWQYFVLIASLCTIPLQSSAFWWPKSTTETPRSQVLQQIPLTYFRTYTYQPLAGETFSVPLFGYGAAQTPLLSGRHYNPYAVTSYAAARRHDAAAAGHKTDVTPPAMGSSSTLSSTSPAPSTTTTSTTTTTPAPTTTTTTTTSTTTSSTTSAPPPPPSSTTEASSSQRYAAYNAEYPTYTRRVNNLYNTRPQYPYPDYFNYQPQSTLSEKSGTRIQFVPCMCPVSMPSMSSLSGMGLNSASTSTDQDRPTGVSISSTAAYAPATVAEVPNVERNIVSVQARQMESEEAELEDEGDAVSTEDTDTPVDSKVTMEQQDTTPTLESNSLV